VVAEPKKKVGDVASHPLANGPPGGAGEIPILLYYVKICGVKEIRVGIREFDR
jgi:hypothetical protein